jgi:hypothetical protein
MVEGRNDELGTPAALYLAIIGRYKEYIEQNENISVAELPSLVTPKDQLVQLKADEIRSRLAPYYFESKFEDAANMTFEFINREIREVQMPLQFWLRPREALTFRVGDTIDRSILMCSIFVALGNPSTRVLVCIKGETRRVHVYCEFNGRILLFDLGGKSSILSSKEELIGSLGIDDDTTAYEFNDQSYLDID